MQKSDVILSTRDLTFKNILKYPDLAIHQGEFVFVEGESGAGKSTLFKLFNFTYTPTTGEILFDGEPTAGMDTVRLRRDVLLVSQAVFLFDGTIRENFDYFYDYRDEPHRSDEEKQRFLELAKVPFQLSDPCQNMSGGERQRVYLAICLSFAPRILMLDEPTSALDQKTAHELFSGLKQYARDQDMTVITISHDQVLADEFADRSISVVREG